jgi:predicted dehydrogenase
MKSQTQYVSNRRQFLQRSFTAAGIIALPDFIPASALGADGNIAPSNRITVGCIGVGGQGTRDMRGILVQPEARIVAVCDAYAAKRNAAKKLVDTEYKDEGCAVYGDWREVLARKDIDAVLIAPQDHWHAVIATAAAKVGKHMYCEKPLGVCYYESRAIRDAVRKHKLIFQTGTQQRSDRKFRQACELALNGYLGKVHTVEVAAPGPNYKPKYAGSMEPQPVPEGFDWDMWQGPAVKNSFNPGRVSHPDWYLIWEYCAGFIVNWGVHHLDIALWGCPELAQQTFELECAADYRKEGFTNNVNGWSATFTYPGGLRMVYKDASQQKSGVKFIGDKGWVYVDRPTIEASHESLLGVKLKDSGIHLQASLGHAQNFLECVRQKKDPVSDVDAGHRASYFGMISDIAARLKQKVTWNPVKEAFEGNAQATAMLNRPLQPPWKLS